MASLRRLNAPVKVMVRLGRDGTPSALVLGRGSRGARRQRVEGVQERWRIDEGWWWEQPVSRLYWRLVLDDGRLVTVYRDLREGTWWMQRA